MAKMKRILDDDYDVCSDVHGTGEGKNLSDGKLKVEGEEKL